MVDALPCIWDWKLCGDADNLTGLRDGWRSMCWVFYWIYVWLEGCVTGLPECGFGCGYGLTHGSV